MVMELHGGNGEYSTDTVIVMVVHCASYKKKKPSAASILTETKCTVEIHINLN